MEASSEAVGSSKIDRDAIYSVAGACAAVGVGETFIRREIKQKRLVARRLGAKVLRIKGEDLQAWLDDWTTTTASMASCEQGRDGSQSGQEKTASERALASAIRS